MSVPCSSLGTFVQLRTVSVPCACLGTSVQLRIVSVPCASLGTSVQLRTLCLLRFSWHPCPVTDCQYPLCFSWHICPITDCQCPLNSWHFSPGCQRPASKSQYRLDTNIISTITLGVKRACSTCLVALHYVTIQDTHIKQT